MTPSDTRRIIIATQNTDFGSKLKKFIESKGFKVIESVVVAEHLIETIEEAYENDEPVFGLIVITDLAYKLNDKRLEYLSDVLLSIRTRHSEIRTVVLSNESEGHPLLAELVNMGIYNIFVRSATNSTISIVDIMNCFEKSKEFAEVAKYREYSKDIAWRKIDNGGNEISVKTERRTISTNKKERGLKGEDQEKSGVNQNDEIVEHITSTKDDRKVERPLIIDDSIEDFTLPFPTVKEKIIIRNRVFGSVVIAVLGAQIRTGTTHSAISLSYFLSRKGNKVAIVECNESSDFKYVELAYEGIKDISRTLNTKKFDIDGVDFYKSDNTDLNLISLLSSEYNFVVLDLGGYEETSYFEEFLRSDIQIVVACGSEWKQRHLKEFLSATDSFDHQTKWNIVIPLIDAQTRSDIESDLSREKVFALPYHPDPFRKNDISDEMFEQILSLAPVSLSKNRNRKHLKYGFVISLLIVIFIAFLFLRN
ncbi:hypothetical protein ABER99_20045 [Paenibacillus glucanolyticus]|uniref:Uncharacterized protein n=1 Tax=Paenibacillus glucanolyticus TaxID=59843 RepID=A0A163GNC2_9BACL|nr:hypothetical protein [Paenibacillus glucanolyticus]KZS45058.1 hypothetical protein AWU65_03490 [Paenibacillus glucanolyticus]OMF64133.1 hypothetical protein BK142_32230 [Paenibacillus glucanolyticus]